MGEMKGRTTLRRDYASFPQCPEQQLEVRFLEQTLRRTLRITRIRNYDIEFVLLVRQKFKAIANVHRDVGVLETNRHARQILLGEPDNGFIDVTKDGVFDGGVLNYFAKDTPVAAADNEDAFGVRVGIHGEVGYHFLVAVWYQLLITGSARWSGSLSKGLLGRKMERQTYANSSRSVH